MSMLTKRQKHAIWGAFVLLLVAFCGTASASQADGKKYIVAGVPPNGSASGACAAAYAATGEPKAPNYFINPSAAAPVGNTFACRAMRQSGCPAECAPWFEQTFVNGTIEDCEAPGDMEEGGPCEPPPEDECEYDGRSEWVISPSQVPLSFCDGPMCRGTATQSTCSGIIINETDSCTALVRYSTDSSCAVGDGGGSDAPEEPPQNEECQSVGDGQYCASPKGDGKCGYVNDTYVCLSKIREDECKVLADGGRVCGANASTTPPVPDNGTPGEPATPDGAIKHGVSGSGGGVKNYSYYNSVTVTGSSRDPGTDGASPSGGSPSGGNDDTDGDGDGDGAPDCEGATCGEGVPELEDIGTMTEAFTDFWSDLQEVPLVEAASNIAPAFPAGACPTWMDTIDVYGQPVDADFRFICTTWNDVSPVLSMVALVFWGVIALRVLLSA